MRTFINTMSILTSIALFIAFFGIITLGDSKLTLLTVGLFILSVSTAAATTKEH